MSERRAARARGFVASARREPAIAHACLVLCLLLAALPVVLVEYPPIFDYANHLARAHVIDRLAETPVFAAHFHTTSFLIPNVLADLLVLGLIPFGGVLFAGKALLLATFALTVTGAYAVNRRLTGGYSPWPLLTAVLLYNEGFFWGFLNYNLGLGLLMWGMAVWLALERRSPGERMVVSACFALLVFLAHLVAFGLYAVAVAAIEARRRPDLARLAQAGVQFVPPALVFLTLSPAGELAVVAQFDFSVPGKIMPMARLLSSGNPLLDVATGAALLAIIATGLLGGLARCQPTLLLLAVTFLVLVLTLPFSMLGSFFLDSRIVIAVALTFAASLAPRRGPAAGVAVVVVALVGGRTLGLLADWRVQDADYAALVEALDRVPAGSVIVTTVQHPFELGDWVVTRRVKPSHEHSTLYATIRNGVLVPNVFARRGQNPLVFDSALEELDRVARNPVARIFHAGDARWLVGEVMPIANRRATVAPPIPAVYVVGYHVPCPWWPADAPIRPVHCAATFSLIEVLGDVGEPVP